MTATESLLPKIINDFCNKIGTSATSRDVRFRAAVGGGRADIRQASLNARL
jgi:hypothetical protein